MQPLGLWLVVKERRSADARGIVTPISVAVMQTGDFAVHHAIRGKITVTARTVKKPSVLGTWAWG